MNNRHKMKILTRKKSSLKEHRKYFSTEQNTESAQGNIMQYKEHETKKNK